MGKIIFALIIFTISVASTSCGFHNRNHNPNCIFLQDFDYMVQLLEDTFPFFGVAERRHGIDMRELLRESRELIAGYPYSIIAKADSVDITFMYEMGFSIDIDNLPELDAIVFWELLFGSFFVRTVLPEGLPIAHLIPLTSGEFDIYRTVYAEYIAWHEMNSQYANTEKTTLGDFILRALMSPNAVSFYQEFSELTPDDSPTPHFALSLLLMEYFSPGLAMGLLNDESVGITHTFPEMSPIHRTSTTSYTILDEGRIAYLRIPTFLPDIDRAHTEQTALHDLFRTIRNYEHLIIDIRRNSGGATNMWYASIMYALWPDMEDVPSMPLYAFYVDSELGRIFADVHGLSFDGYDFFVFEDEYVYASSLPYFNEADMPRFTPGTRINTNLGAHRRNPVMSNIPFAGEIWLLICSINYSSAEMFARHAKYLNFATLVGERTGGGHTYSRLFFALPNTGIVLNWDIDYLTDAYGRSLEEFPTTPHYFNREGLCAFQTVMEMISERN